VTTTASRSRGSSASSARRARAKSAERYRSLITPTLNVVAADRDGHVVLPGGRGAAAARLRSAARPLPGSGAREWQGLVAPSALPAWEVPADGFRRQRNLPVGSPYPEPLPRYDWPHDRAARMMQLLAADPRVTVATRRRSRRHPLARGRAQPAAAPRLR